MNFHKFSTGQTVNLDAVVLAKPCNDDSVTLEGLNSAYIATVPAAEFAAAIRKTESPSDPFLPFARAVRDFCAAVNRMPTSLRVHY